ncbi:hypothetical protein KCP73_15030 [Salmonella enterica subsp. enterica]|nr:hypothetical protein KCP73_15030 [Salmonella enterica subsp. enterica]
MASLPLPVPVFLYDDARCWCFSSKCGCCQHRAVVTPSSQCCANRIYLEYITYTLNWDKFVARYQYSSRPLLRSKIPSRGNS